MANAVPQATSLRALSHILFIHLLRLEMWICRLKLVFTCHDEERRGAVKSAPGGSDAHVYV